MSIRRKIEVACNGCTSVFYAPNEGWVDGPPRSAASHEGWKYVGGKDICPDCVAAASSCPIKGVAG